MSVNNSLIDGFSIIKNGYRFRLDNVLVKKSKKMKEFLRVLKENGFIRNYVFSKNDPRKIKIFLKYSGEGNPAIRDIRIISTSSNYTYCDNKVLWTLKKRPDFGCFILDSPAGIMTSKTASKCGAGGELLCCVS